MPQISICIPTYNRSRMLAELLDSIIDQGLEDEIEVVVSDDASPDDTVEVGRAYEKKIKNFKFIAQPKNLGLDANFLAVVAAASAPYIWLMGDDDRLEPGGAQKVLDAIRRWPDAVGLTLGVLDYDVEMRELVGVRAMPPTQLLAGAEEVFSTIVDLLGFMSALVVRRDLWNRYAQDPAIASVKNYYVQVLILGRVIGADGKWGVVNEPCVGFRTGNDQFAVKFGWVDRLKIDVDAYNEIADSLFSKSSPAHSMMRKRVFNTHVTARVVNAKTAAGGSRGSLKALGMLARSYMDMPKFWTRAVPLLLAPSSVLRAVRKAYKAHAKSSGASRAREVAAKSGK